MSVHLLLNHPNPGRSSFKTEWGKALRSERFARRRRRIRALRARTRTRQPGCGPSITRAMRILVLKLLEAELGFHKSLLKILGHAGRCRSSAPVSASVH
jgi:hypothetical protein